MSASICSIAFSAFSARSVRLWGSLSVRAVSDAAGDIADRAGEDVSGELHRRAARNRRP